MPNPAESSILDDTKKALGIAAEYTPFDDQLIMHVNSVFSDLHQLAVGPPECFFIEDKDNKWSEFTGDRTDIFSVKSYMYLRIRLLWDQPGTSFAIASLERQAEEALWRLNITSEGTV